MKTRVLVAIPIVAFVALAVILQGWLLAIFAAALALACQHEVIQAMDKNGRPVVKSVAYALSVALAILFLASYGMKQGGEGQFPQLLDAAGGLFLLIVAFMAAFIIAMFTGNKEAPANTAFTLFYPQVLFLVLYYLILRYDGRYYALLTLLLLVFVVPMFTDTAAYLVGGKWGRRKLCPAISPKKTVAGCVGGVVGGIIASVLILVIVTLVKPDRGPAFIAQRLPIYLASGAALSAASQIGDLMASFIKRSLNIKDFGKILPGHGGIVDRMDSIMVCIPIVYLLSFI